MKIKGVDAQVHELKTWPEQFAALYDGRKLHEVRKGEDREFKLGDVLQLREWVPGTVDGEGEYTGREVWGRVTYITKGGEDTASGLPAGLTVMSVNVTATVGSTR